MSDGQIPLVKQGDAEIVLCYKAGKTINQIGKAFHLTKQRVWQILKANNCTREMNPTTRSRRLYAFISANVTKDTKEFLTAEAKRRGKSLSHIVNEAISERYGL